MIYQIKIHRVWDRREIRGSLLLNAQFTDLTILPRYNIFREEKKDD